jgi:hypothetical protein
MEWVLLLTIKKELGGGGILGGKEVWMLRFRWATKAKPFKGYLA